MSSAAASKNSPHDEPAFDSTTREEILVVLESLKSLPGALLPILHAIQDRLGFVPPASVPLIAQALNLSRAEVHGVISFYHHFRSAKPGRHVVQLCRAEACQAMGAREIERHVRQRLGIDFNATTADQSITLEAIYCLGNCACAPSASIDGVVHSRLTVALIDQLIDRCESCA